MVSAGPTPRLSAPRLSVEEYRFISTDFNSYNTVSNATGAPQRVEGYMQASEAAGLGIEPKFEVLGPRLVDVS